MLSWLMDRLIVIWWPGTEIRQQKIFIKFELESQNGPLDPNQTDAGSITD